MNKAILLGAIGTVVLLGLGIVAVFQNGTIETQGQTIIEQKNEIVGLEESLEITIEEKQVLLAENAELRERVAILRDSVQLLSKKVRSLEKKVIVQKNTINTLQAELSTMGKQYEELKEEIARLSREKKDNKVEIAQIEMQKAQLRQEMDDLSSTMINKVQSYQMSKEELMDMKASESEIKRIASITDNARVRFQHISLRKNRYGKPLKRMGKDGKSWRYTVVEFYLEHPEKQALLDEEFIIKIVDAATGVPLSHIEPNPAFPNSYIDSKGIEFRYDGNLVELAFRNNEAKSGLNYEIQISYLRNGEEYLLLNGAQSIILDSKPVQI